MACGPSGRYPVPLRFMDRSIRSHPAAIAFETAPLYHWVSLVATTVLLWLLSRFSRLRFRMGGMNYTFGMTTG